MFNNRIINIIVVIIAIISFGTATIFFFSRDCETWSNERKGTSVEGTVVGVHTDYKIGELSITRKTYDLKVVYNVDGVSYKKTFNNVIGRRRDGEKVTVIYFDTPNGDDVVLKPGSQFVWLVPLGALVWFLYATFRKKPAFNSEIADSLLFGDRD